MSIKDLLLKINPFYNLLLILGLALIFFVLGRVSALDERHTPIRIEYPNISQSASSIQASNPRVSPGLGGKGEVIGSKSGQKYYFPWCGTVKRIKPENQVSFASIEEARSAGYLPGGNCKGLK